MSTPGGRMWWIGSALAAVVASSAAVANDGVLTPIATALETVEDDVRLYNDHLVILASPYMQGRVPGSEGMERAKDYVEYHFREVGLEAPFTDADGAPSFRQPFDLGGTLEVTEAASAAIAGGKAMGLTRGEDFNVLGLGGSGSVTGPVTFVGYSIDDGPGGYSSYADDTDLEGRIALMLRFEPMDDAGRSRWAEGRPWSGRASFRGKINAAVERGAAGIVIVNPPGADDARADSLMSEGSGGGGRGAVPIVMWRPETADAFVRNADLDGRSLRDLREHADTGGGPIDLAGAVSIRAGMERTPVKAENVGGLLPGRGELADEYIVIGAHLDHLGMGYFGSRSGPGALHPGADDNASGSAGLLLFAKLLGASFETLGDDVPRRSILFMAFSGEESGLNGSRAYVQNPLVSTEQHALMINFDMIGRIVDGRVSISGAQTGEGLDEWLQPFFASTPLTVVQPRQMSGASDHTSFYRAGIPVLFAIIADFHDDYHTPEDVSWKINRLGATQTIHLFHDIALAMAQRPERFPLADQSASRAQQAGAPSLGEITVRFGVTPGTYEEGIDGIPIAGVTEGAAADLAGVESGDVLVRWDGQKIDGITSWMEMLAEHEPGDVVRIGVLRNGEEITLEVKLQAR